MMHNLVLEEGDIIQIESVSLPVATFSKFQPQSPDFLDITNPKAVLENALRNFACLTTGDLIAIKYNSKIYELCVLETKPGNAVSIIECDMNVSAIVRLNCKSIDNFEHLIRLSLPLLLDTKSRNVNQKLKILRKMNQCNILTHKISSHFLVRVIVLMVKRRNVINPIPITLSR